LLTIGEFSQSVRLSVKTLRYYQELGILLPAKVDDMTGYRYYDRSSFQRGDAIITLKEMGFSLKEMQKIFDECRSEEDLQDFIGRKIEEIRARKSELDELERRLTSYREQSRTDLPEMTREIQEIELTIPHYVSLTIRGRYEEIGDVFRTLYKKTGRHSRGKPYCFFHDLEYKEENAHLEGVIEIGSGAEIKGLERGTPVMRNAVKAIYRGPYGGQGHVYLELFSHCRREGYTPVEPLIEHYVSGPGMIFQGNPKNYITECIVPFAK